MKDKFKIGDVVTWGLGVIAHVVVGVGEEGVTVDSTSSGFGALQADGSRQLFVSYEKPEYGDWLYANYAPEHTDMEPDSGPYVRAKTRIRRPS